MVELGMAIAWNKPVFLFRDDFRRCTDSEAYPLNLMVFTGLPEAGWQMYWYGFSQRDCRSRQGARPMVERRHVALNLFNRLQHSAVSF